MKATLQILTEARELIRSPLGWTAGALARDAAGEAMGPGNKQAVQFCALGAIVRVEGRDRYDNRARTALGLAAEDAGFNGVVDANNTGGHGIAILMFDRAIKRLRSGT